MIGLRKRLANIETLRHSLVAEEQALGTRRTEYQALLQELQAELLPPVKKAVERFNVSNPRYRIDTEALVQGMTIFQEKGRPPKPRLNLHVRIRYPSGNEVDEEFAFHDVTAIANSLRPLIDEEFLAAKLPMEFGTLSVPTAYYMK